MVHYFLVDLAENIKAGFLLTKHKHFLQLKFPKIDFLWK